MGFIGFVSWFCGGMMIVATTQIFFNNVFITAFIAGAIMGVLGAKE